MAESRKIRLLVVSEPGLAGVKRHVVETLSLMDLDEYDVLFLYSLGRADDVYNDEIAQLENRGIACIEVPMTREISPLVEIRCSIAIMKHCFVFKPDIIHCHSAKAGFLGRFSGTVFNMIHNGKKARIFYTPNAMLAYSSSFYLALEKLAAWMCDKIIAVTPSEKEDIVSWGVCSENKVECVPMGVRSERHIPAELHENKENASEFFTLGACGRICKQKNPVFFFEVCEILFSRHEAIRAVWIGDFSDDQDSMRIRELLDNSAYKHRYRITGWISDANSEIADLDLFCMFSEYESFGFVTADAMHLGVPVVGINSTGTVDLIIDQVTGFLIEKNIDKAVAAIEGVYENPEVAKELSNAAIESIDRRFNPVDCVNALSDFYKRELRNS